METLYRNRHWVYTLLVALLLAEAAVYFTWVRGPAGWTEASPALVAEMEREVNTLEAEVERLRRVRQHVPVLEPELARFLAEHLPSEQTGYSLVAGELEELARQAGIELRGVQYNPVRSQTAQQEPDLAPVEVRANLEGRFDAVLGFLEGIEKSDHFYLVDELGVGGRRSDRLRLSLKMTVYFRRASA